MTFAKKLKTLMDERGINQTMLAKKSGLSKSAISQYLSNTYEPAIDKKKMLADALGCTMRDLNGRDDTDPPSDSLDVKVVEAARILNKPQQFVREALKQGVAPFGFAVSMPGGKYSYHISRKKLNDYISA